MTNTNNSNINHSTTSAELKDNNNNNNSKASASEMERRRNSSPSSTLLLANGIQLTNRRTSTTSSFPRSEQEEREGQFTQNNNSISQDENMAADSSKRKKSSDRGRRISIKPLRRSSSIILRTVPLIEIGVGAATGHGPLQGRRGSKLFHETQRNFSLQDLLSSPTLLDSDAEERDDFVLEPLPFSCYQYKHQNHNHGQNVSPNAGGTDLQHLKCDEYLSLHDVINGGEDLIKTFSALSSPPLSPSNYYQINDQTATPILGHPEPVFLNREIELEQDEEEEEDDLLESITNSSSNLALTSSVDPTQNSTLTPELLESLTLTYLRDRIPLMKQGDQEDGPVATGTQIGPFRIVKVLGEGSFSTVYEAILVKEENADCESLLPSPLAIKMVPLSELESSVAHRQAIFREISILKRFNRYHKTHKAKRCMIQLYKVFKTTTHLCLVMELVSGGDLLEFLLDRDGVPIPVNLLISFMKQMTMMLSILEEAGVVHGDLKLENVMLADPKVPDESEDDECNYELKLIDFGLAKYVKANQLLKIPCGSEEYVSPEILLAKEYDGFKADRWSLGVIFYALLFGALPFNNDYQYQPGYARKPASFKAEMARRFRHSVCTAAYHVPKDFATFAQRYPNSWEAAALDLLSQLLTVDPDERIGIQGIFEHPFLCRNFVTVPDQEN